MQSLRILAASAAFDPSKRTVLPTSAAVKGPRFRRRDWELSSQVREILDDFHGGHVHARAEHVDAAESIVMAGNEILNSLRTGSHVVKQRRTVDFATLPELSIAEPVPVPDDSLRGAASEALAAINNRRPAARRVPRAPDPKPSKATSPAAIAIVLALAALIICALVSVVRASL
ncbi:MAG TPA: hypothetical protein VN325_35435 [Steroidobacteraceae bacterium]|nr:hypothetical protein [Steroidobacteraceae bacterium]